MKSGGENIDDTNEAIALLEAAVRLDTSCAGAYAQLARAYSTHSFKFTSQDEGKRLRENADVALAKALDLEPNLAEAHFARGVILWTKAKGFPHEQAIRAFQKALELDPDADETHHQLSMVYSHVGLLDEAQRHVARAIDLNPNNTMARFRVSVYASWQCRFEDALAVLKTVPADVSPFLVDRVRAEVYVQLGRPDKARPIVDDYLARHPTDEGGSLTGVKALLLAKAGETREARRRSPARSSSAGASAIFITPRTTSPPRMLRFSSPRKPSIGSKPLRMMVFPATHVSRGIRTSTSSRVPSVCRLDVTTAEPVDELQTDTVCVSDCERRSTAPAAPLIAAGRRMRPGNTQASAPRRSNERRHRIARPG